MIQQKALHFYFFLLTVSAIREEMPLMMTLAFMCWQFQFCAQTEEDNKTVGL